jgi:hypothetical protein
MLHGAVQLIGHSLSFRPSKSNATTIIKRRNACMLNAQSSDSAQWRKKGKRGSCFEWTRANYFRNESDA